MNNEQHVSLCILTNSTSKVESTFHISDRLGYSSLKSKRTLRSQILPIITSHKTRLDGSETSRSKTTLPSIQSYIVFFPPHFSFVPLALLSFPHSYHPHCSVPFFSTPPPLSLSFLPTLGRVTRAYSSRGWHKPPYKSLRVFTLNRLRGA